MNRKRKKLNNSFNVFVLGFIFITISYISITLFDTSYSSRFYIPDFFEENMDVLKSYEFTDEDIKILSDSVSQKNISYLIDSNIDKNLAMHIINETYYIDAYLERYLNYYTINSHLSFATIIAHVNSHVDQGFYQNTEKTKTNLGKYVILNKHYFADASYQGEQMIKVNKKYSLYNNEFMLSKECYDHFLAMYNDAVKAGYELRINSAYRSYERQKNVYDNWVKQDGNILADTYSARAGYSEHQTGYAFDVRDYPLSNDDFSKTQAFTWMSSNAYKYGFIIRFPLGKEEITGYQYESWHYRYVGVEAAQYIYDHDITFEEYYEYFIRFKNPRNL